MIIVVLVVAGWCGRAGQPGMWGWAHVGCNRLSLALVSSEAGSVQSLCLARAWELMLGDYVRCTILYGFDVLGRVIEN